MMLQPGQTDCHVIIIMPREPESRDQLTSQWNLLHTMKQDQQLLPDTDKTSMLDVGVIRSMSQLTGEGGSFHHEMVKVPTSVECLSY